MPHTKLFEKLKTDYGLRENHILILEALQKEDMTADEICLNTKIPKGRIYEFLNFLLKNRVIEAKGKYPGVYSVKPLPEKIRNFLELKFQNTVKDEAFVKDMINKDIKKIISINSSEELLPLLRKALISRKKFKVVTTMLPHLFYTNDISKFKKFTDYFVNIEFSMSLDPVINLIMKDAFWKAYDSSNEFDYIIDQDVISAYKKALKNLFSKEQIKGILKNVKEVLEKENVNVRISKVKNPYYMVVTECEVFLAIIVKRYIVGAYIQNKEIARIYERMFNEQISNSDNILKQWEKIFKGL